MISVNEVLNADERASNRRNQKKLVELIRSGECILMAGAGCSANIHPIWVKLMSRFTEEVQSIDPTFPTYEQSGDDILVYADRIKDLLGIKYYTVVDAEYKPKTPSHEKFHEILCSLPFRGITTTNYDLVLERAMMLSGQAVDSIWISESVEEARIFDFLASLNKENDAKKVFHLHGIHYDKQSIVLCSHEYLERYGFSHQTWSSTLFQDVRDGNLTVADFEKLLFKHGLKWTRHRKILWALLATRRVLFLGFSLEDPYFLKMFEALSEELHPFDTDNHYLVLRITSLTKDTYIQRAKHLKKQYGIETVFYEDDDTYKGLERFIIEMNEEINQSEREIIANESKGFKSIVKDEELTRHLMKVSREKNNNED